MVFLDAYHAFCRRSGHLMQRVHPIAQLRCQNISTSRGDLLNQYPSKDGFKANHLAKILGKEDLDSFTELLNAIKSTRYQRVGQESILKDNLLSERATVSGIDDTNKNYLVGYNIKRTETEKSVPLEEFQIEFDILFRKDQKKTVVNQVIELMEAIKKTFNAEICLPDPDITNGDQICLEFSKNKAEEELRPHFNDSQDKNDNDIVNCNANQSNQSIQMQSNSNVIQIYKNMLADTNTESDKGLQSNFDSMIGNVLSSERNMIMENIDMVTPLNDRQKRLVAHCAVLMAFNILKNPINSMVNRV